MRSLNKLRIFAVLLFVVLALSFLWCAVDDIVRSAPTTQSAALATVSATTLLFGFLWLVGHGVHGAAVVAVPFMFLRWTRSGNKGTGQEL